MLDFDSDGLGAFETFNGSFENVVEGLRLKSIEANGNLYFTTLNGIKKLSSASTSDLIANGQSTDYITEAGGIKALDMQGRLQITPGIENAWFQSDSIVNYRHVWAINDANTNLVQGVPSQLLTVSNPLLNLVLQDYNRFLGLLDDIIITDTTSHIGTLDDYISDAPADVMAYGPSGQLLITDTAQTLYEHLIGLGKKLDAQITFPTDMSLTSQRLSATSGVIVGAQTGGGAGPYPINFTDFFAVGDYLSLTGSTNPQLNNKFNSANQLLQITSFSRTTSLNDTIQFIPTVPFTTPFDASPISDTATTFLRSKYSNPLVVTLPGTSSPGLPPLPAVLPSHQNIVDLQGYLQFIYTDLQLESTYVISVLSQNNYMQQFSLTTTATVDITVTIPPTVTTDYFLQVYRSYSSTTLATGTTIFNTLTPQDNEYQVYEVYLTQAQLNAGTYTFTDVTPDVLAGAALYTNQTGGVGIQNANEPPPLAYDITKYKNVLFYANIRTKYDLNETLVGVSGMINDYNNGIRPSILIANQADVSNTYSFTLGKQEVFQIDVGSVTASTLNNKYFTLTSGDKYDQYYVWYSVNSGGTDPLLAGYTGIKVNLNTGDNADVVARRTGNAITRFNADFTDSALITNITKSTNTVITSPNHGLVNGNLITIKESNAVPSIDGAYTVNVVTANTFTLLNSDSQPVNVNIAGSSGYWYFTDSLFNSVNIALVTLSLYGYTTPPGTVHNDTGFTFTITTAGQGENAPTKEVLLSPLSSPSQAIDETARSLVRVINRNAGESVYGFYTFNPATTPGQFTLESRIIDENIFYMLGNDVATGISFAPAITPLLLTGNPVTVSITASSNLITTSSAHGLINTQFVLLENTGTYTGNVYTNNLDGYWEVLNVTPTTFTINTPATVSTTIGVLINSLNAVQATNTTKTNRIFYSQYQQPEAVPILNFFDVGETNKAIIRIVPLMDSLFVFKQDGLYRVSGESAPFTQALFDSSCIVIAPDSPAVVNNYITCWAERGISIVSESGVNIISRSIDAYIKQISSSLYTTFNTATWGAGYESDNAYYLGTVTNPTDTLATQILRYSNLTNSWTILDKTNTCGLVNSVDDLMYMGAGDVNNIEQERKTFTRTDYADRELDLDILPLGVQNGGTTIQLSSVSNITDGDVIYQSQAVSVDIYNALLMKLDLDSGSGGGYFLNLQAFPGDNMRLKLTDTVAPTGLTQRLDMFLTPGYSTSIETLVNVPINSIATGTPTIITSTAHGLQTGRIINIINSGTTPDIDGIYQVTVLTANTFTINVPVNLTLNTGSISMGTFSTQDDDIRDIYASYNTIINRLNSDTLTEFRNYLLLLQYTNYEAVITNVDVVNQILSLNVILPWLQGAIIVYKAINSTFTYCPITFGDAINYKHLREATAMFDNQAFTSAVFSFATDLVPGFQDTPFQGDTNGIFGLTNTMGGGFFGGASNARPFRTYIPRDMHRCRYLTIKFTHDIAREKYSLYGVTITGNVGLGERAYRS
jgi:hypothetical protein